jgi:hypothetical protein
MIHPFVNRLTAGKGLSRSAEAAARAAAAAAGRREAGAAKGGAERSHGGDLFLRILALADRAGWAEVCFGEAHHFLKVVAAIVAMVFVKRHGWSTFQEVILYPSIAYSFPLSRDIV